MTPEEEEAQQGGRAIERPRAGSRKGLFDIPLLFFLRCRARARLYPRQVVVARFVQEHEAVDGPPLAEGVHEGEVRPREARVEGARAVEAQGLEGEADDSGAGADLRKMMGGYQAGREKEKRQTKEERSAVAGGRRRSAGGGGCSREKKQRGEG